MAHQKIVLVGAGSLQFGLGTVGSILQSIILKGTTISLHDINPESLELVRQATQAAIDEQRLEFTVEATTRRTDALKGATFIINSIEVPPRFELWDQDYEIPRKHGSKQVFGENGGPGGLFHALRIIPPILDICADVEKICPGAWFINFSNPMSRICLAIKRLFPQIRTIGLCHELGHFLPDLGRILQMPVSQLEVKGGGLNHFGVFLEVKDRDTGKDLYPSIRERGPTYLRTIPQVTLITYILEKFGYLPLTPDSHYGEYIGWAWEKADHQGIHDFKYGYRADNLATGDRLRRLIKKGKGAQAVKQDDERAIPIIEGLLTNSGYTELSVNVPNDGVITNLSQDLVVECPATIDNAGMHPIKIGEYPAGLAALLRSQASVQDLVVQAVLQRSRALALQALLVDPVCSSVTEAERTLDEMLALQAKYFHLQ